MCCDLRECPHSHCMSVSTATINSSRLQNNESCRSLSLCSIRGPCVFRWRGLQRRGPCTVHPSRALISTGVAHDAEPLPVERVDNEATRRSGHVASGLQPCGRQRSVVLQLVASLSARETGVTDYVRAGERAPERRDNQEPCRDMALANAHTHARANKLW